MSMHIAGRILRFVEERNHDTNNVLFILCNFNYMGQNNTAWYKIKSFGGTFFLGGGSGIEGLQDSANKPCVYVHLTPHPVIVLSIAIVNIIRVVIVQTFTDVSSTLRIQNGVVKFNSDQW